MGESKAPGGQTREHRSVEVRDVREMPTITIRRADLDVIAAAFDGRAVPIARSIYLALIEVATLPGAEVTRKALADTAGVTTKALAEYGAQFEALGLAAIERRQSESGGDLPSLWRITDPPATGGTGEGGRKRGDTPLPSSTTTVRDEQEKEGGSTALLPPDVEADIVALLKGKRRVDGKLVTEDEMRKAAAALAAFNAAQGGADHGLGANLPKLVGRIRERPAWEAAKWVRLVESAWRLRWWEKTGSGRRPTPAVVFGNANVLEQVAMDAAQEAAGTPIADTPERRGRYSRTVEPE